MGVTPGKLRVAACICSFGAGVWMTNFLYSKATSDCLGFVFLAGLAGTCYAFSEETD